MVGLVPTVWFCMMVMAPVLFPTHRYSNQSNFHTGHGSYFLDHSFRWKASKICLAIHLNLTLSAFNSPKLRGKPFRLRGKVTAAAFPCC